MRSKTSIAVCALMISFGVAAASARAADLNTSADARMALASAPTEPQPAQPAVRLDRPSVTETEAGTPKPLRLSLKDPEQRFADAPMPVAMHDIHYDDTPQGFPATVSTVAFVRKF